MTAMNETAEIHRDIFQEAHKAITRDTYVNDILPSIPTVGQATKLMKDVEKVLASGGFKIKRWIISGTSYNYNLEQCDDI